ncbi:ribonuclease H protein [Trifolium medium]|uniref:Ribonuclease H protein n=1 Tax=Trifolium medium TaxID=97028 RepID=A0A392MVZ9_9FABA|nr:ribonuclease H protein [Trifolium medium]
MCTENFAHLLRKCYLKHFESPATRMVRWNAQGGTGMILNVDGSSIGNHGVSGFGGLIRNSDGAWVHIFAGKIGFSNILHAELSAVYHGLILAWGLDIKELWCYSNSKTVIKLLAEPVNAWTTMHLSSITLKIYLLKIGGLKLFIRTLREGNACADYLAKLGTRDLKDYSPIITTPPAGMSLLLLAEANGTLFTRYSLRPYL